MISPVRFSGGISRRRWITWCSVPPAMYCIYKQTQLAIRQRALVVDAHDVVVIELRQSLRLGAFIGRDLDGERPLHRLLPGKKNLGKSAGPQLR